LINFKATPDRQVSNEISKDVTNKLINSLSSLIDYWADTKHYIITDQAKVNIHNLSFKSNNFWLFSAFNRRLYEITLSEKSNKIKPYIDFLPTLNTSKAQEHTIVDFCKLSRFQQCLFSKYATEGYPDPQVFQATDGIEFKHTQKCIIEALEIIRECLPQFFYEIKNYINTFVLFSSQTMSSGSSSHLLKCIYIQTFKDNSLTSLLRILDRIIHETAHMHLHLLSMYDPLVLNSVNEKFTSPFRKDPRPMIGVFHAYFVLFRLILVMRDKNFRAVFKNEIGEVDDMLRRYENAYQYSYKVVLEGANFTKLGKRLFDGTFL